MSPRLFTTRSTALELMDDLNCAGEVVHQTLREIEFINRTLGGNAVTVDGVVNLMRGNEHQKVSVVDVGCGGGGMLLLLAKQFERMKVAASFTGVDANPNIVNYAARHVNHSSVSFAAVDILSENFKQLHGDIAVATLFLHHFTHDQLVGILSRLVQQVKIGIVINDLHRHFLAYHSIKLLTRLFSKSKMVQYDAPLSVLRGFSKVELENILNEAGIKNYSIKWRWAFRWQVIIKAQAIV
jgi:2-polyprenyl-3-methyl-5-hydroxy-6-metoxy-1,4-benzoquinol methylase